MWDAILDWLAGNYPFLIVAIIIAAIVWIVARFYYTRFKKIEQDVSELPCIHHEESFKKIMEELSVIRTYLVTRNPKSASLFSEKMSPRRLNIAGRNLLNDIDGTSFLEENEDDLFRMIEEKQPKTALDVEIAANEVLIENLDSDIFNRLKLWVYNSPTRKLTIDGEERDYAITMNDICFILSLPLRDMYLDAHPEIQR